MQELDIESLPPIDALAFGFPCNDYSIVGEHKGMSGDYGPLYSYGVKVLNYHNPKFLLLKMWAVCKVQMKVKLLFRY